MAGAQTKIAEALKEIARGKELDKISVDEIITKAGVSRQSFYKYFSDKYDLAYWIYNQEVCSKPLERYAQTGDFEEINLALLRNIAKDPLLYKSLFKSNETSGSFISEFHRRSFEQMMSVVGRHTFTPDLCVLYDCWTTGTDTLMANWISNGMKEDIEWLADIFMRTMPQELKDVFCINKK